VSLAASFTPYSRTRHGVTVTLALAGLPIPPWVDDTIVVVLFFTPVDVAVSVTRNVQL
jgi:hypothetical protein